MIDLRSDTLTIPTSGMLAAMGAADLGDDVYGEDRSVNRFEAKVAERFGFEAGLFTVTGSLANLLGIWAHTREGGEVLCDSAAHIARAEMGAHATLHGVTMRTWKSDTGLPPLSDLVELIAPDLGPFLVKTSVAAFENTHNFAGGIVLDYRGLVSAVEYCHRVGIATHLDGARIWNAEIATGLIGTEYGRLFDTMSVCFSKGLGAPIGSMLLGSASLISSARTQRKRLGAGWRQAGVLAAAAEYALDHHYGRLVDDHEAATVLAETINSYLPGTCATPQTNIVVATVGQSASRIVAGAAQASVLVSQLGARTIRAVTHQGVTVEQSRQAGQIIGSLLLNQSSEPVGR